MNASPLSIPVILAAAALALSLIALGVNVLPRASAPAWRAAAADADRASAIERTLEHWKRAALIWQDVAETRERTIQSMERSAKIRRELTELRPLPPFADSETLVARWCKP